VKSAVRSQNWLVRAPGDFERIEACFSGVAFAPHRHNAYAIGITLQGVQRFDYRGSTRDSLPGQVVVLHPDELHDGRAGNHAAFRYRTMYVSPALIQDVLGGKGLPFIKGGISSDPHLRLHVSSLLTDFGRALNELELQDALYDLTFCLLSLSGGTRPISSVNRAAAMSARDYIEERIGHGFSLDDLERVTRHSRWQLSRDFRAMFGTSPYRYLVARRLDRARGMMLAGYATAEVAAVCGFSDQSHFGRLFKKSYGLTPNAWISIVGRPHNCSIPGWNPRPE
jgi:AraC-like DNA-binding protein